MGTKLAKADVTPVRQRTQYSCMAASLSMCLKANGLDMDEDTVNKVMGARPMQGASWEQALAAAQHFGMRATLIAPCTLSQLKEWTDAGIPVMIAWNPEGRPWSHASVVFDVDAEGNVHVADPNIPDPEQTVRISPKGDFFSKWGEKWPDYIVRRPAMAIEREITSEGKQMKLGSQTKLAYYDWSATIGMWVRAFGDGMKFTSDGTMKWTGTADIEAAEGDRGGRLRGGVQQVPYKASYHPKKGVTVIQKDPLLQKALTVMFEDKAREIKQVYDWEQERLAQQKTANFWNNPHESPKGVPYPKSKWDHFGHEAPFYWATPAPRIDGTFPEPWRVSDKDKALKLLKRMFPDFEDIYTDYEPDLFGGRQQILVGLRDNRNKVLHNSRITHMMATLRESHWGVRPNTQGWSFWLLDDLQKNVLQSKTGTVETFNIEFETYDSIYLRDADTDQDVSREHPDFWAAAGLKSRGSGFVDKDYQFLFWLEDVKHLKSPHNPSHPALSSFGPYTKQEIMALAKEFGRNKKRRQDHMAKKTPQNTQKTQDERRREEKKETGTLSKPRDENAKALAERGTGGTQTHKNKQDYDRGQARNPKHKKPFDREGSDMLESMLQKLAGRANFDEWALHVPGATVKDSMEQKALKAFWNFCQGELIEAVKLDDALGMVAWDMGYQGRRLNFAPGLVFLARIRRVDIKKEYEAGDQAEKSKNAAYEGNPGGEPIYPNEIDHGYDQPLAGGTDVMKRLQNQYLHEQGDVVPQRDPNPKVAQSSIDNAPLTDAQKLAKSWLAKKANT